MTQKTLLRSTLFILLSIFFALSMSWRGDSEERTTEPHIFSVARAMVFADSRPFATEEESEFIIYQGALVASYAIDASFISAITSGNSSSIPTTSPTTSFIRTYSPDKQAIIDLIIFYANIYGANPELAVEIARCESGFNVNICNRSQGCDSGQGIFQMIASTWASTLRRMNIPFVSRGEASIELEVMAGTWLLANDGTGHWGNSETSWGSWSCWGR